MQLGTVLTQAKNTRTKDEALCQYSQKQALHTEKSTTNMVKGKYFVRQSSEVVAAAPVNVTTHGHKNEQNSVYYKNVQKDWQQNVSLSYTGDEIAVSD